LHLVANLLEDVADLSTQLDGNQSLTEQLHELSAAIDLASQTLTEVREELAGFRLREVTANPKRITELVAQTRGPLERLAGAIESIRLHVADAREALEQVRSKVRFWARTAAVFACLLAAWLGWGQICLLGWGWARCARHQDSAVPT
jgi:hypothetical protein